MAYRLKQTGVATSCTMCIAVDPDTLQLRDFANADVDANMHVGAQVSVGTVLPWGLSGGTSTHPTFKATGNTDGITFPVGHRPKFEFNTTQGFSFVLACRSPAPGDVGLSSRVISTTSGLNTGISYQQAEETPGSPKVYFNGGSLSGGGNSGAAPGDYGVILAAMIGPTDVVRIPEFCTYSVSSDQYLRDTYPTYYPDWLVNPYASNISAGAVVDEDIDALLYRPDGSYYLPLDVYVIALFDRVLTASELSDFLANPLDSLLEPQPPTILGLADIPQLSIIAPLTSTPSMIIPTPFSYSGGLGSIRIDDDPSDTYLLDVDGLGVLAEDIPSSGAAGPSFLYSSISLPGDAGKEISGLVTSYPTFGALETYEDGTLKFFGAPEGGYSFTFDLIVDGVNLGSATVLLNIGDLNIISIGNVPSITLNTVTGLASLRILASTTIAGVSISTVNGITEVAQIDHTFILSSPGNLSIGDNRPLPIFLRSSLDHSTGAVHVSSVEVAVSQNGAPFAADSGATIVEMGSGMYSLQLSTGLSSIEGRRLVRVRADGCDVCYSISNIANESSGSVDVSAIAEAVRLELAAELALIDVAISSRLAAASYVAPTTPPTPPTAGEIADEVRVELATELSRVDVPISSRLAAASYVAPTTPPTPPTAGEIADEVRVELAVELSRIDTAISSRMATTDLTASQIGLAVLGTLVENGYSLSDMIKLIAASTQGDAIGLENNGVVKFYGLDGVTERIVATQADGNRTVNTRTTS